MGQQLGVGKAAHILGVSRHDLQRLIHDGELNTFEGQVDMDELRQRYPALALKDDPVKERIDLIRGTAFGRRVRETLVPESDALQTQLRRRNADLSVAQAKVQKFRGCIEELAQLLGDLNRDATPDQKRVITVINSWLLDKLER